MAYILPFSQLNRTDIASAGGKGANLGELAAAGFPVPAGFVLATAAYDAFVAANHLQPEILALAGAVTADQPDTAASAAQSIQALFQQGEIPADVQTELLAAHQQLVADGAAALAVRSSATAEDLPTASFAGQQDTYLNVRGEAALLVAVKNCWASLWTARAISYRLRQEIDPATVSLAVVVQLLVPASAAGVLFTVNPVTGKRDEVLINGTWGLGEAIVSGQVTPDTLVVAKESGQILSRETARKAVMTVLAEEGTEEQTIPAAHQADPVLADAMAQQLARLGAQIEAHYGRPMDIEWALADSEIAILQARPVTALTAAGPPQLLAASWEPPTPDTIWMRRQIVEHMPQPLSPLFADLYLEKGLNQAMNELLEAMAEMEGGRIDLDKFIPQGFARTINGYAYTTGSFTMSWPNLWAILKIYARIYKFFRLSAFDWEGIVLPRYQGLVARWGNLELATAADKELLHGISELATADSRYWFGSALKLGLSRMLDPTFDRLLRMFFIRYALPEPRPSSAAFLRGFDSKALAAQADIEALAALIRASASLKAVALAAEPGELIEVLAGQPEGEPILAQLRQHLAEYGHQIYNLDFADPTQNDDPLPLLITLQALVEETPEQDARSRQSRLAAEREALVEETMQRLNPVSRFIFRWVWRWTKEYAPYREHVMFYMGLAWPTVRALARELGERLVGAGALAAPDDIYYLESSEIEAVIAARETDRPVCRFADLAQERRALREARQALTPPPKVPERGSMKFGPLNLSMFDPTPTDVVDEGPVLRGYAVSTGRVTAPASVILSSADFRQMKPGTILVCTTTTPAWTPLFAQAVGLVTDVGGALAHGSIVAREYGIPAVMGTGVATGRIKSGMRLVVDGDAGTVTLLEEEPPTIS